MPYIDQQARDRLKENAQALTAGELQYIFATLIKDYLDRINATRGHYRYQDLNDIMGALNGANLEFYRRVVAPYENDKIDENGDCY